MVLFNESGVLVGQAAEFSNTDICYCDVVSKTKEL